MIPAIELDGAKVYRGDCREVLRGLADNSVDSIVTDPPYELGFMGKKWDSSGIAYDVDVWQQCLRVLKPGGHLLAFGGSRTFHRLAVAIEDAGYEIRDTIAWISSKTFPKSLNVAKAITKQGKDGSVAEGWGTGLKQVVEPVVLARKPLEGTVADNFLHWGVGALNIDASRVEYGQENIDFSKEQRQSANNPLNIGGAKPGDVIAVYKAGGRWPANLIIDELTALAINEQSGLIKGGTWNKTDGARHFGNNGKPTKQVTEKTDTTVGGASRFFYVATASKKDRNEGLAQQNSHPTVKPVALMQYLIRLVTPPGGIVLDPFTGSGSTGKAALLDGYKFIGAELTDEYLPIIENRLRWALDNRGDKLF